MVISGAVKRRLVVSAVAVAALALPFTSTGHAVPVAYRQAPVCPIGISCGNLFYSDVDHTNLVGSASTDCQGHVTYWGSQNGYIQYFEYTC
jgi:hypothetical protein